MRFILFTITVGIVIIYLYNSLLNWARKKTYINAGKKWDNIVDELRKRK